MTARSGTGGPRPAWRLVVAPAFATLIAFGILVSLGLWQLDRRTWKESLLSAIANRSRGEAVAAPPEAAWPRFRPDDEQFRRVRVSGTFRHEAETLVHGLMEERRGLPIQGFYVFTPLVGSDGAVVMVNRGFVPTELRAPSRRQSGQVAGPVEVTGLLRVPEAKPAFVPANDPGKNEWFVRDLDGMAEARGLERLAPFYVDADATPNPGGFPKGGQTQISLPTNHLQYALTWFSLAGVLLAVAGVFIRRRVASRDELQPQNAGHDQPDAG